MFGSPGDVEGVGREGEGKRIDTMMDGSKILVHLLIDAHAAPIFDLSLWSDQHSACIRSQARGLLTALADLSEAEADLK